ncbi:MAG: hypothetical protein ACHP7P_14290 [Terriglobales bacterium]
MSYRLGDTISIRLQTVGPGDYAAPPSISSPAVQFLDAKYDCPCVPAGPTQLFRLRAAAPGEALVAFHHTGLDPTVFYIVVVH